MGSVDASLEQSAATARSDHRRTVAMHRGIAVLAFTLTGLVFIGVVGLAAPAGIGADSATITASASTIESDVSEANGSVSEEAYVEPAPEEGELYYEAGDDDWVSYINPRDEYRSPYLGDGSGKIGVTLLNEAGEPIVGESVPDTTVTIETGEKLSWHSEANPVTVQYPLTDHYDRPLDSDQFGTTDDLVQGDGYMDTHSIEMHGLEENATIEYGEVQIEGEHADKIDVVGYIEQPNEAWDTDVDAIEDAESYEEVGGEWTYTPDGSHGQVVVVLQLDSDETGVDGEENDHSGTPVVSETGSAEGSSDDGDESDDSADGESDDGESDDGDNTDDADVIPGFGVPAVIVALALVALALTRRQSG